MSVVWHNRINKDANSHVLHIEYSGALLTVLISLLTLKTKNIKVIKIINAKGKPKLCANSKNKLWECSDLKDSIGILTLLLWKLNRWEKVDAPHPKIGFLNINEMLESQIWILGAVVNEAFIELNVLKFILLKNETI